MGCDYSIWAFAYARSNMPRDFFGGTLVESNRGTIRNPMVYTALYGGETGAARRLFVVDTGMKGGWSPSGKAYEGVEHPPEILAKIGFAPEDVEAVILTHLHFDHAGNLDQFPNARFCVQRREYEGWRRVFAMPRAGEGPSWPMSSIDPEDFAVLDRLIAGGRVTFIDGDAEIAPGIRARLAADSHTFGSQWLEIETADGPYIVAGDCVYWYSNIERMWPPGYVQGNAWNLIDAYRRMRAAIGGEFARIVPGHDPLLFERHRSWIDGINPTAELHLAARDASRVRAT